jgi:hypothetical protein
MHLLDTIDYLQYGTPRQREAYMALTENGIIEKLVGFTPILAGTIPLNIDIETSDLDILCCFQDEDAFYNRVCTVFEHHNNFTVSKTIIEGKHTVLANFLCDGFEIEIFGQNVLVKLQWGYLHMMAEYAILQREGEEFRKEVIELKSAGYKTEPAFAKLLGLKGDPYKAILDVIGSDGSIS